MKYGLNILTEVHCKRQYFNREFFFFTVQSFCDRRLKKCLFGNEGWYFTGNSNVWRSDAIYLRYTVNFFFLIWNWPNWKKKSACFLTYRPFLYNSAQWHVLADSWPMLMDGTIVSRYQLLRIFSLHSKNLPTHKYCTDVDTIYCKPFFFFFSVAEFSKLLLPQRTMSM